jgi:O-methyltransferase
VKRPSLPGPLQRMATSPRIARGSRAARLLAAEYHGITGELSYHSSDAWREEFSALKNFIRRAFQVLAFNGIEGDYAEFGCWGARTFTLAWGAARLVGHPAHLWAFDSFEGLPDTADPRDNHPKWQAGAMAMTEAEFRTVCAQRGMAQSDFTTVPGFYSESLTAPSPADFPERISFAYIDCDLYTSTSEVLQFLAPRLQHGMILAFDDYYCYGPTTVSGERLAAGEFFANNGGKWQLLPFVQYGWAGMSFIVEDSSAGPIGVHGW